MVHGLKPMGKPSTLKNHKFWTEPRPCMVHGLKPMGKLSTLKNHKFWTEPRPCMVHGLKPMGNPSTLKNHEFWTEPRPCMVHRLNPMGKPSTKKEILQVLDRTKALHGPRTQAYGNQVREKIISFGQNQGLAWSTDSSLWGNQVR